MTDRIAEFATKNVKWENPNTIKKEGQELKNALHKLDNFRFIDSYDKIDMLGVICDIKPFCLMSVWADQSIIDETAKMARGLNLKVVTMYPVGDVYGKREMRISKSEEILNQVRELDVSERIKSSEAIGKLLGYPESSTQAYIHHDQRLDDKTEQLVKSENLAAYFSRIVLSKDHYQEEIDNYGAKLMMATKKLLPNTYKKMLMEWKILRIPYNLQKIKNIFKK